jgi:hypothetical protein
MDWMKHLYSHLQAARNIAVVLVRWLTKVRLFGERPMMGLSEH